VQIRVVPITVVSSIIFKKWILNQVKLGLRSLLLKEIEKEVMCQELWTKIKAFMVLKLIDRAILVVLMVSLDI
jgi:hypothetical protein